LEGQSSGKRVKRIMSNKCCLEPIIGDGEDYLVLKNLRLEVKYAGRIK